RSRKRKKPPCASGSPKAGYTTWKTDRCAPQKKTGRFLDGPAGLAWSLRARPRGAHGSVGTHVVCQHRKNALGGVVFLHHTVGIQHLHQRSAALLLYMDAIGNGFSRVLPTEHAGEDVGLFDLLTEVDIQVTDEVVTRGTVAIFDREAGRIDGNAHTAPGTVEVFCQGKCRAVRQGLHRRPRFDLFGFGHASGRRSDVGAQIDHQACQHGGVQTLVFLAIDPAEGRAVGGRLFHHVLVADVDFRRVRGNTFEAGAEAFPLAAVKHLVNDRTQRLADPAFRNLGTVFGPVGFDETGPRVVGVDRETLVIPEFQQLRVNGFGGTFDHQPAQVAITLDLDILGLG